MKEGRQVYSRISPENGIARHFQVRQQITEAIRLGYHDAGDRLPTEEKMSELFGVSRITIRKALDDLAAEGLIEKAWGRGSFVGRGSRLPGSKGIAGLAVWEDDGLSYHPAVREILRGITDVLSSENYGLKIIHVSPGTIDGGNFNHLKNFDLAGLILNSREIPDSQVREMQKFIPRIVSACKRKLPGVPWVILDFQQPGYDMTKYLLELGHKKIAFIQGSIYGVKSGGDLYKGYRKALAESGLELYCCVKKADNYTSESGCGMTIEILKQKNAPTAVICEDAILALGAVKAAHKLRMNCPGDISIAALTDFPSAEYVYPPLTAVKARFDEKGRHLAQSLIEYIRGVKPADKEIKGARLAIRGSTGPVCKPASLKQTPALTSRG